MNENHPSADGGVLSVEPLPGSGAGSNASAMQAIKEAFTADRKDSIFAIFAFVLGFFFARWVLYSWQGWGVALFTLSYCGGVVLYLLKKEVPIPRVGWFWLAVVVLTGISYALWTNRGLEPWRSLFLLSSGVYWIICATGLPILGKTSNWIVLDGLNGFLIIPFHNFGCQYKSLAFLGRNKRAEGRQVFSIVLGLFLTFIVVSIVLPQLIEADSGGFSKIANGLLNYLHNLTKQFGELFLDAVLAIPIAAYLFGLVAGSAHRRGIGFIKENSTREAISNLRVLRPGTIYTLMGLLCCLYVVFIVSQLPYFFSAFVGQRPEGWQVYSEYARRGFFELCRIAAINLSVLTAANVMSKKLFRASTPLKILNSLMAVLTLLLIATAMSKMILYIGAYGLSMRRLLPCFFMILLAVVCVGVIALQKWQFSMVRLAAGVSVVMLCTLCLLNPDGFVARYNADRYLSGTLDNFDVEILYRSGPAGVDSALKVYTQTGDEVLKAELKEYLLAQQRQAAKFIGNSRNNWQWADTSRKIDSYSL